MKTYQSSQEEEQFIWGLRYKWWSLRFWWHVLRCGEVPTMPNSPEFLANVTLDQMEHARFRYLNLKRAELLWKKRKKS